MSILNTKVSKIVVGVLTVAVLVVGFAAVKVNKVSAQQANVSASDIQYAATVRQGSSGQAVIIWQKFFNDYSSANLVADGQFGPLSNTAARNWQAGRGLVADGILGAMSRAAAIAQIGTGSQGTVGGATCPNGYLLSNNCMAPTTTEALCPNGMTLASNCTTAPGSTTSTTLQGGAGSVEEYKLLSSPSNNREVGEDQSDVKVLGMSIEADDNSDLMITAVKLDFTQGTANRDLEKYASDVSVWLGSKELARVDASDFTDDNNFDKTISLASGAIIKAGAVGNLYVALSGVSNLDSADDAETWTLDVTSVRFVDAQGAVISEDPLLDARTFTAELFATAADVELKLTESSSNPDAKVIEASDSADTDNVTLFKGSLKATGSDINLKEMTFTINSVTTGTADASDIASRFVLKIDGNEVQSLDSGACDTVADCNGDGAVAVAVYTFDDVDVDIDSGSTVSVELLADINEIDGVIFVEGDSLAADVDNDDTVAEDEAGEDLADADTTGAIVGEAQTFYDTAFMFTKKSVSAVVTSSADPATATSADTGTYVIKFELTAFGGDVSINRGCIDAQADAADQGVEFTGTGVDDDTAGTDASCSFTSTADDNPDDAGASWLVREGETEEFTLTVALTPVTLADDTFAKVYLTSINWDNLTTDTTPDLFYTAGLGETKTSTNELYLQYI